MSRCNTPLEQVQSGAERWYPHRAQPVYNKVRPGSEPCRKKGRYRRVLNLGSSISPKSAD